MTCSQTRDLFYIAGGAMKLAVDAKRTSGVRTIDSTEPLKAVGGTKMTPAESNARAAAFWANQSK